MSGKVINFEHQIRNYQTKQLVSNEINPLLKTLEYDIYDIDKKGLHIILKELNEIITVIIDDYESYLDESCETKNLKDSLILGTDKIDQETLERLTELKHIIQNICSNKKVSDEMKTLLYDATFNNIYTNHSREDIIEHIKICEIYNSSFEYSKKSLLPSTEILTAKEAFMTSNIHKTLSWIFINYIDRFIKLNEWDDYDISDHSDTLIEEAINYIKSINPEFFYNRKIKSPVAVNKAVDEFINDYALTYDPYFGEYNYIPKPLTINKPQIEYSDVLVQALKSANYHNENNISFIKDEIESLLEDLGEEYKLSKKSQKTVLKNQINLIESKKLDALILEFFKYNVFFYRPENSRYETNQDILIHKDFFISQIWKNLELAGFKDDLAAYRVLKNYDFITAFKDIKKKYYPKDNIIG